MTRRAFLCGFPALVACLGAFGLARAADAQQPASPRRIGVLLMGFAPDSKQVQGLDKVFRTSGYTEGRDVVIRVAVCERRLRSCSRVSRRLGQSTVPT